MISLKEECLKYGISLDDLMLDQFQKYYDFLIEYNTHTNLTRIVEHDEVMIKHFLDSLLISKIASLDGKNILDIGSGAGFPGIPMKIISKNSNITMLDSNNKKTKFLNELILKLGLKDASAILDRAEDLVKTKRESFDLVTARAVARLNILVELALPFVKVGGYFIAMKSSEYQEELDEAKNGIEKLGAKFENVIKFELPYDMGEREFIIIKKIKKTDLKYPRMYGQIKNRPL